MSAVANLVLASALSFMTFSQNAIACELTNGSPWYWSEEQLIQGSPNIFLIKIRSFNKNGSLKTDYQSEVIEVLKTNDPSRFFKGAEISLNNFAPSDTDTKSWEKGWGKKGGRAIHTKACEIWVPFTVDKTYLIFFETLHSKAYEEVKDPAHDAWFNSVKRRLRR